MNWAIIKNTWHMCLASKLRQLVVTLFILYPLMKTTMSLCIEKEFPSEYLSDVSDQIAFVLACGSGCIGGQLNDGTLSLVLSRPIKISSYALSKWLAVAIAASTVSMIQFSAELFVALFRTPYALDATLIATNGTERILLCFGFSAVFMFFSSLVSGSKDLAVYLVFLIASGITGMLAQIEPNSIPEGIGRSIATMLVPPIGSVYEILHFILEPTIALTTLLKHGLFSWIEVTAYFSVIAFFVSVCIYSLNRRELPYGAD
jgi:hypothetical protein